MMISLPAYLQPMKDMLQLTHQQFHEMMTSRPVNREEELGYSLYHSNFENVIDEPVCKGTTRSTQIREGVTLLHVDLSFLQNVAVEMMSTQPQVGFGFCLKGHSTAYINSLDDQQGADFSLHLSDRTAYIYANTRSSGYQHFWSGHVFQALYIHFSYESFREMLADSIQELPPDLINTLNREKGSYMYFSALPQPVLSLCYALLENPFKGKSREFFTEAKAIELIAYQIDALLKPELVEYKSYPPLTIEEAQKIDTCYQALQQNLGSPPSPMELARGCGLSVYRLKNGFRQRYGDTPFRLLTELRMLRAKELLEGGELNVSEVALEVGYTSLGTFSNTFYERFKRRPSAFKK